MCRCSLSEELSDQPGHQSFYNKHRQQGPVQKTHCDASMNMCIRIPHRLAVGGHGLEVCMGSKGAKGRFHGNSVFTAD